MSTNSAGKWALGSKHLLGPSPRWDVVRNVLHSERPVLKGCMAAQAPTEILKGWVPLPKPCSWQWLLVLAGALYPLKAQSYKTINNYNLGTCRALEVPGAIPPCPSCTTTPVLVSGKEKP